MIVSIPLWFDYNMLQFEIIKELLPESLNSTMVRLQLTNFKVKSLIASSVSIPLWFDYNC